MPKARIRKNLVTIICPACRDVEIAKGYSHPNDGGVAGEHTVPFAGERAWVFNGDLDRPTLSPSLKLTYTITGNSPPSFICHTFVSDGRIQYLADCTHALAGQTVELPECPTPVAGE